MLVDEWFCALGTNIPSMHRCLFTCVLLVGVDTRFIWPSSLFLVSSCHSLTTWHPCLAHVLHSSTSLSFVIVSESADLTLYFRPECAEECAESCALLNLNFTL